MEEREEIKLKILLLVILSIPIIISILFILGVNKVYAADSIQFYATGGTYLTECYNCYNKTSSLNNRKYLDINYTYNYQNNTNLNIQFNHILEIIQYDDEVANVGSPTILVASGWTTYNVGSYCTQVVGTQNIENLPVTGKKKTYNYAYSCDFSNYGANFPNYNQIKVEYTLTGDYSDWKAIDNGFQVISTPYQQDNTATINSATGNIINNQNQNTQEIINNNNNNTQSIIDNQNANSQAQIDKIDESFNSCETYNSFDSIKNGYVINGNGVEVTATNQSYGVTDYIRINKNENYIFNTNITGSSPHICTYNENKTKLNCYDYSGVPITININQDGYIRYTNYIGKTTTLTGEYCYNRLDGKPYNNKPVDTTNSDDYHEKEQELLDLYNDEQLDTLYIIENTDGNDWVWARITQFLNTNEYIRLMFISILSLGIIKLVLSR